MIKSCNYCQGSKHPLHDSKRTELLPAISQLSLVLFFHKMYFFMNSSYVCFYLKVHESSDYHCCFIILPALLGIFCSSIVSCDPVWIITWYLPDQPTPLQSVLEISLLRWRLQTDCFLHCGFSFYHPKAGERAETNAEILEEIISFPGINLQLFPCKVYVFF